MKGRHEFKVGASFIYEPTLDITFSTGQQPQFTHLGGRPQLAHLEHQFNGSIGGSRRRREAKIPNKQYAAYLQDTWRVNDKLTLDLGVRYDLITGFAFDQDAEHHLRRAAGRGQGRRLPALGLPCPCSGFEDFGKDSKPRTRTTSRRASASPTTCNGDGRTRACAAASAATTTSPTPTPTSCSRWSAPSRPSGRSTYVNNTTGIQNADGIVLPGGRSAAGQPARQRHGSAAEPCRLADASSSPTRTRPTSASPVSSATGFAMELDGVYSSGKDLGTRPNLNRRVDQRTAVARGVFSGFRRSGSTNFRVDTSDGSGPLQGRHPRREEALGRQAAAPGLVHAVARRSRAPASAPRTSSATTTSSTCSTPSRTSRRP